MKVLVLAGCTFKAFPWVAGDSTLQSTSGDCLSLRTLGKAAQENFFEQVTSLRQAFTMTRMLSTCLGVSLVQCLLQTLIILLQQANSSSRASLPAAWAIWY